MHLLVTGGAGYIGSVVAARLLEEGHRVTVLDDLSRGHRDAVPEQAEFVQARIHDAKDVLEGGEFDAVVHLAAFSLVAESVAKPTLYQENNVVGTALLCDAMKSANVKRLIFSSTAAVYGEPDVALITEATPTAPVNPYGASKLAIDQDLAERAGRGDLGAISLRYFNVAGAYGRFGERHDPETHLIPIALEVAAGRRAELTIFGDDFPTRDGTCVRDYIHVLDIANAHVLALEALRAGSHEIANLGNGAGFSVREVADAVREMTGQPIPVVIGPRRSGDPATLLASNARARELLGWSPTRPAVETMVADAWALLQDRGA